MSNKIRGIEKIVKKLDGVSCSGVLSRLQEAETQGHLNFASAFFVSKSLKFLLGRFDAAAKFSLQDRASTVRRLCELTKVILLAIPPRCFEASLMGRPRLLFTDGAWEDDVASAGLVFFDAITGREHLCRRSKFPVSSSMFERATLGISSYSR